MDPVRQRRPGGGRGRGRGAAAGAPPPRSGGAHRLAGDRPGGGRAGGRGLRAVRGRHQGLGGADHRRAAARRGGPAGRVRAGRDAGRASAAAAADRAEPVPRRRVPGHRAVGHRHLRDLLVPDLLPAANPGLLTGQDRTGLPADDRRPHPVLHDVQRGPDAAVRAPPADPGRPARRVRRPGLAGH